MCNTPPICPSGSGKSYSIRGEDDEPGILPYLCKHLFTDVIATDSQHQYSVRASYYEPGAALSSRS